MKKLNNVSLYALNFLRNKYPFFQTKNFKKNVAKALAIDFEKTEDKYTKADYIKDIKYDIPNIVPDGHIIDEKEKQIIIFEIEDSNPLTSYKISKLTDLMGLLESEDWKLEIRITDRYGLSERILPLTTYYYSQIQEEVRKRRTK